MIRERCGRSTWNRVVPDAGKKKAPRGRGFFALVDSAYFDWHTDGRYLSSIVVALHFQLKLPPTV
jgi:hypothetical protein